MAQHTDLQQHQVPAPAALGVLARIFWMGAGNFALALVAMLIAQSTALSGLDLLFWMIVGALLAVRYVDITRLGGTTAEGAPASTRDWYRYAVYLLLAAGVLWALAHTLLRGAVS